MKLKFKRLSNNAVLPTKAHAMDSGFDLYTAEEVTIKPNQTLVIPTGVAVLLPKGYEAQVRPRSGVTSKTKLRVQLGTIDNEYTGDIGIIVDNIGNKSIVVEKNTKLAQLVIQELPKFSKAEWTDEELQGARGDKGFGSSGY